MRKKGRLNCEMIWKIWEKSKLNSEKIGKIRKKYKLNSERSGSLPVTGIPVTSFPVISGLTQWSDPPEIRFQPPDILLTSVM